MPSSEINRTNGIIWKVTLHARYDTLLLLEACFAKITDNTSCYELSSKTIESAPEDLWCFEGYFHDKPSIKQIRHELGALYTALCAESLKIEEVADIDWVQKMHNDFQPIYLGKFCITNTACKTQSASHIHQIIIEGSRAFGTGDHYTTQGCLEAMENVQKLDPKLVLDVGTGTGILAIAATKLWPHACVIGSDIDEVAVEIANRHAIINNVVVDFHLCADISFATKKADLIISNILAKPLITLAQDFVSILSDHAIIILSGFLDYQLPQVLERYIAHNMTPIDIINNERWITLTLQKMTNEIT